MDIIMKIFSYYYSPQPKHLMEDVRNFSKTLNEINMIYFTYWITNLPFPVTFHSSIDKEWLYRDLLNKMPQFRSLKKIEFYIKKQEKIRIIWGILTPIQRDIFVTERKNAMINRRMVANI